jgi:hypothetical protein
VSKLGALVIVSAFAVGCTSGSPAPTAPMAVPVVSQDVSPHANGGNFGSPLSADEEVMPAGVVNESTARGNALFQLNQAGTELEYRLIVANIENVTMAHLHRAPAGANGPVVVWLYPGTAPPAGPNGAGRVDGVIATGTLTAADLMGSLAGQPLSALVDAIKAGTIYVNVHTNDGVSPTNTGPGDFPGGEIRGQLAHRGH